jgi:2'-5' RNA ligase
MSLFTALWPPEEAIRDLAAAVDRLRSARPKLEADVAAGLRGFRFVSPRRWHVTLCFHGDDADEQRLGTRLDQRIPGLSRDQAPRLRLAGAGTFRGVLWVGVEAREEADATSLHALVRAAGGDPRSFHGHLTVVRWGAGEPNRTELRRLFEQYQGPWWSPEEVALVRSDRESGVAVYRTVHRVSLGAR